MKSIRIYVNAKDIAAGRRSSTTACPIAKAIRRITKTVNPSVNGDTCIVRRGMKRITYALPKAARKFIQRYDMWFNVRPFAFRISKRAVTL